MRKDYEDPVVAEVRAIKQAIAEEYNFDFKAMLKDMKAREAASGLTFLNWEHKSKAAHARGNKCEHTSRPENQKASSNNSTPR